LPHHSKFIQIYEKERTANEHISKDVSYVTVALHHTENCEVKILLEGGYVFSLFELFEFFVFGWRLGKGRPEKKNRGVDLLLIDLGLLEDDIAGNHAILRWEAAGGGFFLVASNTRPKPVYLNGECLLLDRRLIPYKNMIGIGNHTYRLEYSQRSPAHEVQFQTELRAFFSIVHGKKPPIIQPTPSAQTQEIGEYLLGHPIAKGGFGVVFSATHNRKGIPVAVKQVLKTQGNSQKVEREVKIAQLLKIVNMYEV
jgi:hypothetical protein